MAEPTTEQHCNWSMCTETEGVRWYAAGPRCAHHSPAALKGLAEPDELLVRGLEVLKEKQRAKEAVVAAGAAA